MQLSIIVPVYNVEEYLPRCINSLLRQGLAPDEHEIILVDDGSTDGSGELCDRYALQHDFIKAVHKANGGLSDARNEGMRRASGDYIVFVDSDDFLLENALAKLVNDAVANDTDLVVANAMAYCEDGTVTPEIKKRAFTDTVDEGKRLLIDSIVNKTYSACSVLGVYKKSFLVDNDLTFCKGIVCEDELWSIQVYLKAKRVKYIDIDFYFHCYRKGSITNRPDKYDVSISVLQILELLSVWLPSIDLSESERQVIDDYLCMLYLNGFYLGRCYRSGRRSYIKRKLPVKLAHSRKNKLKAWLFAVSPTLYYLTNRVVKSIA